MKWIQKLVGTFSALLCVRPPPPRDRDRAPAPATSARPPNLDFAPASAALEANLRHPVHPILAFCAGSATPAAMDIYTLHAATVDARSCYRDHRSEPPNSRPEDSSFAVRRNPHCNSCLGFDNDSGAGVCTTHRPHPLSIDSPPLPRPHRCPQ
jgi:hypothetical protein